MIDGGAAAIAHAFDASPWAGFSHPFTGLDHLLAMVGVGLLSAQIGGRAIWMVPSAFVGAMIAGGLIGIAGGVIPLLEPGIAASVVVLGAALAAKRRLPVAVTMAAVMVFGLLHGNAHGAELPEASDRALFVVGFATATIGLHVIGALIGLIAIRDRTGDRNLRIAGGIMAAVGLGLLVQAIATGG